MNNKHPAMRRTLLLTILMLAAVTAKAQQALDFAQKFMTECQGDSLVKCITVSPRMLEQIADSHQEGDERAEAVKQAIGKLKSMRIVSADDSYYDRAEALLKRHARRFKAVHDFKSEDAHGIFYTRKNRQGETVELIMVREDTVREKMTIVCVTGDIDEEFLCFLYNNKTFKN